jgi:DNA-binding MarR family transcriptional regulator
MSDCEYNTMIEQIVNKLLTDQPRSEPFLAADLAIEMEMASLQVSNYLSLLGRRNFLDRERQPNSRAFLYFWPTPYQRALLRNWWENRTHRHCRNEDIPPCGLTLRGTREEIHEVLETLSVFHPNLHVTKKL